MRISVIVCTHNPRIDHLTRTLAGLHAQRLPMSDWELILVDNASSPPLGNPVAFSNSRVVREPALGLVTARLRGISEATGALLVFVDDDNVLAPDYLEMAANLAAQHPSVGAFGGQIDGEFEEPPSPWFAARLDRLALREFSTESRSAKPDPDSAPCGAGLCVRASVARRYREAVLEDGRHVALGREGGKLFSGDDLDLAFTACDLGLEIARFPALHLTHLIPRERLTLRYFARITRSHARAHFALQALRPAMTHRAGSDLAARLALWKWGVIDAFFSIVPRRRPRR